ncbi:MAG: hypothetical protein L0219_16050 [Phycisphaerales bacterium]|nr:hypothetical protein [Phycisphaerales bacterium]
MIRWENDQPTEVARAEPLDRLLVAVIGNRNSGKSHTWNTLFGQTVRTGRYERELSLGDGQHVTVFLVSGSPEERETYVGDIIEGDPRIVLCSLQYREEVFDSLRYFSDRGFFTLIHWLNPGFNNREPESDRLGLVQQVLATDSLIGIRDARIDATDRVEELRDFIRGWALSRDLVTTATPIAAIS